ncbi:MAG: hypothetical protein ACE37F_09635 [Nannocystaceae bacterium]|nr:SEL1-like repeat protein [bacterium]
MLLIPGAALAGPEACRGDGGEIEGIWGCNPADECCNQGTCSDGNECTTLIGGQAGVCRFSGAALRTTCYCAPLSGGEVIGGEDDEGGGGGGIGMNAMEQPLDSGPSLSEFVAQYEAHDFVAGSPEERVFFEDGCAADLGPVCVWLSILYGLDQEPNFAASFSAASEACLLEDAEGCYFVGAAYATGTGVEADPQQAEPYFEQACALGLEFGCEGEASIPQALAILEERLQG